MKRVKGMLYTLIVFPFVLVLGCTALLMVPVLSPLSKMTPASSYTLENLWTGTRTTTTGAISASVPVHGVVMFRVHH